jgi:hypothetical protein
MEMKDASKTETGSVPLASIPRKTSVGTTVEENGVQRKQKLHLVQQT